MQDEAAGGALLVAELVHNIRYSLGVRPPQTVGETAAAVSVCLGVMMALERAHSYEIAATFCLLVSLDVVQLAERVGLDRAAIVTEIRRMLPVEPGSERRPS